MKKVRRTLLIALVTCGVVVLVARPQRNRCGDTDSGGSLRVLATSKGMDATGKVSANDNAEIRTFASRSTRKICVATVSQDGFRSLNPTPVLDALASLERPERIDAIWGGGGLSLRGQLFPKTLQRIRYLGSRLLPIDSLSVTVLDDAS